MKDDDESNNTWTFKIGPEGEQDSAPEDKPKIIAPEPKPKIEVEKKPVAVGKVIIELEDIEGAAKLQIDRRPPKLRGDSEQSQAAKKEDKVVPKPGKETLLYASLLKRIVAQLIDLVVMTALFVLSAFFVALLIKDSGATRTFILFMVYILEIFFVFVVSLSVSNTSVGKEIMGLQVRGKDQFSISIFQAFFREMIFKPLSILTILGILYALVNDERKSLHDLLSSTVVISKK